MERRRFLIEDIHIAENRRKPDMDKVAEIAKSIRDVGVMNPPAVCIRDAVVMADGEVCDAVPVLIYGRHRLLALVENGEESVECFVSEADDDHVIIMEADENLARSEIQGAERTLSVKAREAAWNRIKAKENTVQNLDSIARGRGQPKQFATETASASGMSRSAIYQELKRADELKDDVSRIVGTSLDKGVEMDALIKLPEPERKELIERAVAGEAVSARTVNQPASTHDADLEAAVAILDKFDETDMPFLLPYLKPKIAAAIRDLMAA